ncbi:MAG: hypothetical protein JO282_08345 [Alphaproteobacteria bacterium]|nr:hypothetical protein [Alphaproteobacteria bacterium]
MKWLGDEIIEFDMFHKRGREPRGEHAFEAGLPRARLPPWGHAVKRSRQPDLGDGQRKRLRFYLAQGDTSVPERRVRLGFVRSEPAFLKLIWSDCPKKL